MNSPDLPASMVLASVVRRFGARLFDGIMIFLGWMLVIGLSGRPLLDTLRQETWPAYAVWATSVVYEIWLISLTGQTIGKRLLSIQVVDAETGAIPTRAQAWRRVLPLVIQIVPLIGIIGELLYVPLLWHPRRQGVHDRFAGTVVIDRSALAVDER